MSCVSPKNVPVNEQGGYTALLKTVWGARKRGWEVNSSSLTVALSTRGIETAHGLAIGTVGARECVRSRKIEIDSGRQRARRETRAYALRVISTSPSEKTVERKRTTGERR